MNAGCVADTASEKRRSRTISTNDTVPESVAEEESADVFAESGEGTMDERGESTTHKLEEPPPKWRQVG